MTPPAETGQGLGKAFPAVAFISLVFLINYTDRAIIGPLLVHMEKSLGLDHVQATSLLLFLSTGFFFGVFSSGFATARFAPRRVVAISAVGSGLMLLFIARSHSLSEVRLGFTMLGLVAGLYLPAAMATLGTLVSQENWSRTIAIHELAPNLSFILSPILAEAIVERGGWQGAMVVMGCVSLVMGTLFLIFGKGGTERTDRPSASGVTGALKAPVFWVFVWFFGVGVGGEFAPFSVLPLSLTSEQGLGSAEASRLLSLSRLVSPFVVLIGGWAATRLGIGRTILVFLLFHGVSLMAMALPHSLAGTAGLLIPMTGQAMATAFVFPALFTLFSRAFPLGQQPMLLSLSIPIASYIGTGITPVFLGVCGEYLSFSFGYFAFGVICLASIPLLRFCR